MYDVIFERSLIKCCHFSVRREGDGPGWGDGDAEEDQGGKDGGNVSWWSWHSSGSGKTIKILFAD